MYHDYTGTPIQFGKKVTYKCSIGNFFEHDKDQEMFQVECLDTGFLDYPTEWSSCVPSE